MGLSESREKQVAGKDVAPTMPSFLELMQAKADENEKNAVAHVDKWFADYLTANDAACKASVATMVKLVMEQFSVYAGKASRFFQVDHTPPFLNSLHGALKSDTVVVTIESARKRSQELMRTTATIHALAILDEFSRVTGVPTTSEHGFWRRTEPYCKAFVFHSINVAPSIRVEVQY
jgi:hypothetical protein